MKFNADNAVSLRAYDTGIRLAFGSCVYLTHPSFYFSSLNIFAHCFSSVTG